VVALSERSRRANAIALTRRQERLNVATQRLKTALKANAQAHAARIMRARERSTALGERGRRAILTLLRQQAAALARDGQLLAALSHRGVLARGFALVRNLDGKPLRLAAAIGPGMPLDIEFADGRVRAQADGTGAAPRTTEPPAKPRSRPGGDGGQGSLFG
jgi:exodeoxyribonuclease VII large subunit